jgi:hypothetical protein
LDSWWQSSEVAQSVPAAGTQTAALAAGGLVNPPTSTRTSVNTYDGTSWTTLPASIPSGQNRAAAGGIQTSAVIFGGNTNASGPPNGVVTTATNEFDGTSFTLTANMATARQTYGGTGTRSAAIGFGGDLNPGRTAATEEFNSTIFFPSHGCLGERREFTCFKKIFSRSRNSNCCFVCRGSWKPS